MPEFHNIDIIINKNKYSLIYNSHVFIIILIIIFIYLFSIFKLSNTIKIESVYQNNSFKINEKIQDNGIVYINNKKYNYQKITNNMIKINEFNGQENSKYILLLENQKINIFNYILKKIMED